jgi:predicted GNAT superfamily acetyltransferase
MQVNIRNIEDHDLDAALALNESVLPHVNSLSSEKMAWFAGQADYFQVADNGGSIVAMLVGFLPGSSYDSPFYQWFCDTYPLFAYIDRVAVCPDLRRSGLAAMLYQDFEATFSESVPMLACEVNILPANATSMAFHKRMGFEQIEHAIIAPGVREVARLAKTTQG